MRAHNISSRIWQYSVTPLRWLLLCGCLILIGQWGFAQQQPSLEELKSQVEGKSVLEILEIAYRLHQENLDLALRYTDLALEKARQNEEHRDIFNIYRDIGFYYENNNQLDKGLSYYYKANELAEQYKDKELTLIICTDLAITHRKLGQYQETKKFHLKSLELAKQTNDLPSVEYSYHGLGLLYETIGDYDKAIELYFKSLEVAEKRGTAVGVITTLQNIGVTFLKLGNTQKALDNIEQAHQLATSENDSALVANVLHDYGTILMEGNRYNEAKRKFEGAISIYKSLHSKGSMARSYMHLAQLHTEKGDYERAQQYFLQCLSFQEYLSIINTAYLFNKLGFLYLKRDKIADAKVTFEKSLHLAQKHDYKNLIQSNSQQLYELYSNNQNPRKAIEYLQLSANTKRYLYGEDKSKRIAEMQFQFDAAKREKEIYALQLQENKILLIGSCCIFLVFLAFMILTIRLKGRNNQNLSVKNEEILSQNIKLKASNEVLKQFAYVAAHDLKEPLRNIGSFINLLQIKYGKGFNEEANEYMGFVKTGVKRLNNLLNDLLEYSQISAQTAEDERVDINQVISIVLKNLRDTIHRNDATIHSTCELPYLNISKLHLTQLLQNLIANAIKFTEQVPVIVISCHQEKDSAVITIKDNGIGISQAAGDKIFNLFHRINKTASYEGTGIGLTICKNIVDKYDGAIWFDSVMGEGTTFYIRLPFRSPQDNKENASNNKTKKQLATH